ncbi:MAG: hypothetical protein Q6352_006690 [Candidatus Freyrarchaeum guaymaensis]
MTALSILNLLALLLYVQGKGGNKGEPIVGKTKLDKLLFLAKMTLEDSGEEVEGEFIPYRQGAYLLQLEGIIDTAQSLGILKIERNDELIYRMPEEGIKKVERVLIPKINPMLLDKVREIKMKYNDLPEDLLLAVAYLKYPDYTIRSEIKNQVFRSLLKYLKEFDELPEKLGITREDVEKLSLEARKRTLKRLGIA